MTIHELWIIQYEDDETFDEKLTEANDKLYRYGILNISGAKELFKDHNIPCGTKQDLIEDKTRIVKNYLKIPFR